MAGKIFTTSDLDESHVLQRASQGNVRHHECCTAGQGGQRRVGRLGMRPQGRMSSAMQGPAAKEVVYQPTSGAKQVPKQLTGQHDLVTLLWHLARLIADCHPDVARPGWRHLLWGQGMCRAASGW